MTTNNNNVTPFPDKRRKEEEEDSFKDIVSKVENGEIPIKDAHVHIKKLEKAMLKAYRNSDDYVPNEYASREFGITAYGYLLENECSADDALLYAMEVHGKDEEWLRRIRNRDYYYTKEVVEEYDNHPEQKKMLRNNTMDRQALKSSRSLNQQLRKLSQQRGVNERLNHLENQVSSLNEQVGVLDGKIEHLRVDISSLNDRVVCQEVETEVFADNFEQLQACGVLDKPDKKRLAKRLKEKGYTQKVIAKQLSVDVRTVKRWWKEL